MSTIPIVRVSIENEMLVLDFEDAEDDKQYLPVTFKLEAEGMIVHNARGRPARGKSVMAIYNSNGGVLHCYDQRYRILVTPARASSSDHGQRTHAMSLPSPDLYEQGAVGVSPTPVPGWTVYSTPEDGGDPFPRYVRWAIAQHPSWLGRPLEELSQISVTSFMPEDRTLTTTRRQSTATGVKFITIAGSNTPLDASYRVKVMADRNAFGKEFVANQVLSERTAKQLPGSHSSFFTTTLGFRFRPLVEGPDQYALAVPLVDSWTLAHVQRAPQDAQMIGGVALLRGLVHLLHGRMLADTTKINEPGRIKFVHGDHHAGNILVWKHEHSAGLRRFAYIDFSHADIMYPAELESLNFTYHIVGGGATLSHPTAQTSTEEAQQLLAYFSSALAAAGSPDLQAAVDSIARKMMPFTTLYFALLELLKSKCPHVDVEAEVVSLAHFV